MKHPILFIFLLTNLLFLTVACNKEEVIVEPPPTQDDEKLTRVNKNGTDQYRFYYDGETLIEYQSDFWILDTTTNESVLSTSFYHLTYLNNRLDKITGENQIITYEYPANDMVIKSFHWQYPEAVMTYKNYQNLQNHRLEVDYIDDLKIYFNTNFDNDGNYMFA